MPQSFTNCWKFAVMKSLRRSPWLLAGWWLLSTMTETATLAAERSLEGMPGSGLTNIADSPATAPISATVVPELQPSPQFNQSSQSTTLIAQAIAPAADGTGTIVNQSGNTFEVTGGTQAGDNLFHSFQQFGLSADQAAPFAQIPTLRIFSVVS